MSIIYYLLFSIYLNFFWRINFIIFYLEIGRNHLLLIHKFIGIVDLNTEKFLILIITIQ